MRRIEDIALDQVRFLPKDGQESWYQAMHAQYEPVADVVVGMLLCMSWSSVGVLAKMVEGRLGTDANGCGFRYPVEDVLDFEEQPFEGVEAYTPVDKALVGTHAFERLVVRFLRAASTAAATSPHPHAHLDFWQTIPMAIARIEDRLRREGALDSKG